MLARKCLEEMERERREMVGSSWEEERRDFFKVRGMRARGGGGAQGGERSVVQGAGGGG